jgi:hypothetical protein
MPQAAIRTEQRIEDHLRDEGEMSEEEVKIWTGCIPLLRKHVI